MNEIMNGSGCSGHLKADGRQCFQQLLGHQLIMESNISQCPCAPFNSVKC